MNARNKPAVDPAELELRNLADLLASTGDPRLAAPYRPRLRSADPSLAIGMLIALPVSAALWLGLGLVVQSLLH
ncbi:hypothetical protein [Sphingobium nicotianae]|uniref:Uncharacterized protein n=1 Tax=Sphingobium nicotianae TaxID=2782607 RepID=A0A9X1AI89_9SPHN|nr:hypothetical protein [Sphingobium nicotianae]MBT2185801.1 hypothetical protein [Sphingobium nicotianae]